LIAASVLRIPVLIRGDGQDFVHTGVSVVDDTEDGR